MAPNVRNARAERAEGRKRSVGSCKAKPPVCAYLGIYMCDPTLSVFHQVSLETFSFLLRSLAHTNNNNNNKLSLCPGTSHHNYTTHFPTRLFVLFCICVCVCNAPLCVCVCVCVCACMCGACVHVRNKTPVS